MRIAKVGWPFEEGRRVHEDVWREKGEGQVDMAGSFLSVSVSGWEVVVCDEVAVMEVLKRRDVFIKPEELYGEWFLFVSLSVCLSILYYLFYCTQIWAASTAHGSFCSAFVLEKWTRRSQIARGRGCKAWSSFNKAKEDRTYAQLPLPATRRSQACMYKGKPSGPAKI